MSCFFTTTLKIFSWNFGFYWKKQNKNRFLTESPQILDLWSDKTCNLKLTDQINN